MESTGNLTGGVMDILMGGVDFDLEGNGGPDCRDHVSFSLRGLEVTVSMVIFVLSLVLGQKFDQGKRYVGVGRMDSEQMYRFAVISDSDFRNSIQANDIRVPSISMMQTN